MYPIYKERKHEIITIVITDYYPNLTGVVKTGKYFTDRAKGNGRQCFRSKISYHCQV